MVHNDQEEMMDRLRISWMTGLMIVFIVLTGLSCAHTNGDKQDRAIKPADHEKMLSEFQKGVEESKKYVVAKVNGVDITMNDLIGKMNQIAPKYIARGHERTPEIDQMVKQEALDIIIFRELAVQEAVRQGMKVTPAQVDETLQKIKANMGSEDQFNKFLDMTGETEESLRKGIERNQLFNMIVAEEIYHKANAGDASEVEQRRLEWEAELKKEAKIEIMLEDVEKKLKEDAKKKN